MTRLSELARPLKPYAFHGVDIIKDDVPEDGEACAVCPFCEKEKLYINTTTGKYHCKVCGTSGNSITFLRALWDMADKATLSDDLVNLALDRGLLSPDTLNEWGVVSSPLTMEWLVPGYNAEAKLCQLYRYWIDEGTGARRLMATSEMEHQLHGVPLLNSKATTIYVCEGPWDGMALWEMLRSVKWNEDNTKLIYTANPSTSLLAQASVLAVPGCNVFKEQWLQLFKDKDVVLCYDNDHPRVNTVTKGVIAPAALEATKKLAKLLAAVPEPPKSIRWIKWGEEGYDPELPEGTDIRDVLGAADTIEDRIPLLESLLSMVEPIPPEWIGGRTIKAQIKGGTEIQPMPCTEWKTLINQCRKTLKWTKGLDRAFSVMLACVSSTMVPGDQLWVKIIGPPSSGKTTMAEWISTAKKYIKALSTLRGFHSGMRPDKGSGETTSLIDEIRDKTLIIKDGDTLLQAPNRNQILAEARDLYDRVARTAYRNGVRREEENVNMTLILCGTSSLRELDTSELGERCLDCVIMEGVDSELEKEINFRKAALTLEYMGIEMNGKPETQTSSADLLCRQLTAGYVHYLRENAPRLIKQVKWSDDALQGCSDLATLVSYLRARPSKKQEETVERELSARLLGQLLRLAGFLTVVLNKKTVDAEVFSRVRAVALDTARGFTLNIVNCLHKIGDEGKDHKSIATLVGHTYEKTHSMLMFLSKLKAVEGFRTKIVGGYSSAQKWRLTDEFRRLYDVVMGVLSEEEEIIEE